MELAKAELGEKAQKVGTALGFIAGGAVLVIPGLVMTLFALSAALIAAGWSQPVSYFFQRSWLSWSPACCLASA